MVMSKTHSKKEYGFSYDSNENFFDKIAGLRYGKNFYLLTKEVSLQLIVFEEMVELDIFYRDPKFQSFRSFHA